MFPNSPLTIKSLGRESVSSGSGIWTIFLSLTANATALTGEAAAAQRKNFSRLKEWLGVPATKLICRVQLLIKAEGQTDFEIIAKSVEVPEEKMVWDDNFTVMFVYVVRLLPVK